MTLDVRRPRRGRRRAAAAAGALTLALAAPADAATWAGGRTTPALRQIVAVDATGESGWPFGREDVAGDGLEAFGRPEQALDVRTGYAAADANRLWLRAYVSDEVAVGAGVVVFVFVDADASAATGGRASAVEIEPKLTSDPSPGGYEYVVGVRGDGTLEGVWAWRASQTLYARVPQAKAEAEAGRDLDPIRVGAEQRGYAQANVELAQVGLAPACGANFFFRSVNAAANDGDLDVGAAGACVAADADGDRVPDVTEPPSCTADEQCPNRGLCVEGRCALAAPCTTTDECPAGRECTADGRCVVPGGGACTDDGPCDGRVCRAGACAACTPGGAECGAGRRCGADGACVGGEPGPGGGATAGLDPDGRVEGGAFNCSGAAREAGGGGAAVALAAAIAAAGGRRARRRRP